MLMCVTEPLPLQKLTEQPVQLSGGIQIIQTPDWAKDKIIKDNLYPLQKNFLITSETSLYSEYETPTFKEDATVLKAFNLLPLALWLNNPANPFESICRITTAVDSKNHLIIRGKDQQPKGFDVPTNRDLSLNDFINTGEFHERMIAVDGAPLEQALYMLGKALAEKPWNIRYLFHWITLESLFGTGKGEVRFRLAQAIALFISKDKKELNSIFAKAKKAYDTRSEIAHGNAPVFQGHQRIENARI